MSASQTFPLPATHRPDGPALLRGLTHRIASPLRRLFQDPASLLAPLVAPGETVLEVGPGHGFHTLPLLELVGSRGRVVAVDCRTGPLADLGRRAVRRGLAASLEARLCRRDTLGVADLRDRVDLVVAADVVHEAVDPERMIGEMVHVLRPGGRLLLAEPRGRVQRDRFLWYYGLARESGLVAVDWPRQRRQMTVVMRRGVAGAPDRYRKS
jgi:SAM-dependent methyltransferase